MAENTDPGVPVQDPYADRAAAPRRHQRRQPEPGTERRAAKRRRHAAGDLPGQRVLPDRHGRPTPAARPGSDSTAQVWYRWYAPNGAIMFEGKSTAAFPATFAQERQRRRSR